MIRNELANDIKKPINRLNKVEERKEIDMDLLMNTSIKSMKTKSIFQIVIKGILLLGVLFFWMISFANHYEFNSKLGVYGAILLLSISIFSIIVVRRHFALLIFFAFLLYCNYSIVYIFYFKNSVDTYYKLYSHTSAAMIGLICLLIFNLLILLFLPLKVKEIPLQNAYIAPKNQNSFLVLGTALILLFILIFGFGRPEIKGERGRPTTFYEYSTILFIVAFYYCGNNKYLKGILIAITMLFALQNFIYGGRVTGLQVILIVFFINFYNVKRSIIYPLGVLGVLFLLFIGFFRTNFNGSSEQLILGFKKLFDKGLTMDTAYSAYHTSMTFIFFKNAASFNTMLNLFGRFLLSIIVGGSAVPYSNPADVTHLYFLHYGGELLPVFMYFYLGFFGVILISLLVSIYIKKACINPNTGLKYAILVYFISSVPRWYLYSPSQITRGMIILIILFYAYRFADLLIKGKLKNYKEERN